MLLGHSEARHMLIDTWLAEQIKTHVADSPECQTANRNCDNDSLVGHHVPFVRILCARRSLAAFVGLGPPRCVFEVVIHALT
jgi:hypothetical protein